MHLTWDERTYAAKRAMASGTADVYQRNMMKLFKTECENYVKALNTCPSLLHSLDETGHKKYPDDYNDWVQETYPPLPMKKFF